MPYTGDPSRNLLDKVRFLLGDTDTPEEMSDPEIQFLLDEEHMNPLRAAARGAEALASKWSTAVVEKQVGPLRISSGTRGLTKAERYMKLAKMLWSQAMRQSVVPWAGGISEQDKQTRRDDSDRVKPSFARNMMYYPDGQTSQTASAEDLKGLNDANRS